MNEARLKEICQAAGWQLTWDAGYFTEKDAIYPHEAKRDPEDIFYDLVCEQKLGFVLDWKFTAADILAYIKECLPLDVQIVEEAYIDTVFRPFSNQERYRSVTLAHGDKRRTIAYMLDDACYLAHEIMRFGGYNDQKLIDLAAGGDEYHFALLGKRTRPDDVKPFNYSEPRRVSNVWTLHRTQQQTLKKYFYLPIISSSISDDATTDGDGTIDLLALDTQGSQEIGTYASRVMPGQTLEDAVRHDLKQDFHYDGAFTIADYRYLDTAADKQGNQLPRLLVHVMTDRFTTEDLRVMSRQASWQQHPLQLISNNLKLGFELKTYIEKSGLAGMDPNYIINNLDTLLGQGNGINDIVAALDDIQIIANYKTLIEKGATDIDLAKLRDSVDPMVVLNNLRTFQDAGIVVDQDRIINDILDHYEKTYVATGNGWVGNFNFEEWLGLTADPQALADRYFKLGGNNEFVVRDMLERGLKLDGNKLADNMMQDEEFLSEVFFEEMTQLLRDAGASEDKIQQFHKLIRDLDAEDAFATYGGPYPDKLDLVDEGRGRQEIPVYYTPLLQVLTKTGGRNLAPSWTGQVAPGQTLQESLASKLNEIYGYGGEFNFRGAYFEHYVKDDNGQERQRFGVTIDLRPAEDDTTFENPAPIRQDGNTSDNVKVQPEEYAELKDLGSEDLVKLASLLDVAIDPQLASKYHAEYPGEQFNFMELLGNEYSPELSGISISISNHWTHFEVFERIKAVAPELNLIAPDNGFVEKADKWEFTFLALNKLHTVTTDVLDALPIFEYLNGLLTEFHKKFAHYDGFGEETEFLLVSTSFDEDAFKAAIYQPKQPDVPAPMEEQSAAPQAADRQDDAVSGPFWKPSPEATTPAKFYAEYVSFHRASEASIGYVVAEYLRHHPEADYRQIWPQIEAAAKNGDNTGS